MIMVMVSLLEFRTVGSSRLKIILSRLIEECKNLRELKRIHTQILKSPTLHTGDQYYLITRLLFFCSFSNYGSFSYATNVFRMIKNPDLRVYNIMIRAYAGMEGGDDTLFCRALMMFKQMLCKGFVPNCLTFPFLVKGCTRWLDGATGQVIHAHVIKFGFLNDVFVGNSLISLYMTCGLLNSARKLFDEMLVTDVVTWNSMVIGYLRNGGLDMALDLFRKMNMKNIITWNSIITGLVQGGRAKESLELFHEMQLLSDDDVVKPDKITVASVLSACAQIGAIDHGKWVHGYLRRNGIECDVVIGTALVNMYGKCGHVQQAFEIFKEMPEKDASAWTVMISVFALHGFGWNAFDCFLEMQRVGVKPNHVTFVGLLSACAHSGLVEQGRWCFDIMKHVYLIEPQVYHYACMVDILSRAKLFDEAEILIRIMPMKPDVYVWGALLGGCQMHGNVELGEKVACHLINLEPHNHAFYMNLCDIYAKAGRFDAAKRIRNLMKERRIKKKIPGCSMIEINGVVQEFSAGGSSELPMKELVLVLNRLSNEMKI
ncbi:pentatricopeptide repeat-containing protein At5g66520-like [Gastrolobium bilobum]|uniref:pentatricopeptide repeat-containing protein At5g66520-like n=1 Tax=Gastrolobium bilobum TaxID=150636 RepID=UPI002AB04B7F|nr:pentatricopeptide repeat-containing protein At5g66520-like [Gastrolobium bilobum]